jgi:hypothetical protein
MALDWKSTSKWWYGRFTAANGKRFLVNLSVKIAGIRPQHISDSGPAVDPVFIESRGKAMQAHDRKRDEIETKNNLQEAQEKLIEMKTGRRLETLRLAALPEAWAQIPRRREPKDSHKQMCQAVLNRFIGFMSSHYPAVDDMTEVSREHMAAFMKAEKDRGVAPRTWNVSLKIMRTVFRHYQPESDAYRRFLRLLRQE